MEAGAWTSPPPLRPGRARGGLSSGAVGDAGARYNMNRPSVSQLSCLLLARLCARANISVSGLHPPRRVFPHERTDRAHTGTSSSTPCARSRHVRLFGWHVAAPADAYDDPHAASAPLFAVPRLADDSHLVHIRAPLTACGSHRSTRKEGPPKYRMPRLDDTCGDARLSQARTLRACGACSQRRAPALSTLAREERGLRAAVKWGKGRAVKEEAPHTGWRHPLHYRLCLPPTAMLASAASRTSTAHLSKSSTAFWHLETTSPAGAPRIVR